MFLVSLPYRLMTWYNQPPTLHRNTHCLHPTLPPIHTPAMPRNRNRNGKVRMKNRRKTTRPPLSRKRMDGDSQKQTTVPPHLPSPTASTSPTPRNQNTTFYLSPKRKTNRTAATPTHSLAHSRPRHLPHWGRIRGTRMLPTPRIRELL